MNPMINKYLDLLPSIISDGDIYIYIYMVYIYILYYMVYIYIYYIRIIFLVDDISGLGALASQPEAKLPGTSMNLKDKGAHAHEMVILESRKHR